MNDLEEHEMLIAYSEMTSFDFSSEEYKRVRQDYVECKNFVSNFFGELSTLVNKIKLACNL